MSAPHFDLKKAIADHRAAKAAKPANPDLSLAGLAGLAAKEDECENPPSGANLPVLASLAGLAGRDSESAFSRAADEIERAAIAEMDGGLPRGWSDALAEVTRSRPAGMAARTWESHVAQVWAFADRHAAPLDAAGWAFGEVFGVGDAWSRLDQRGAAWFALDADALEITPDFLRWRAPDGASRTLLRAGREPHVKGGAP